MRIAFLGDSITKGVPKVSYFEMLEETFKEYDLVNYGKGGDTVSSLTKRIKRINHLEEFDMVFVFVGVNDVYSKINKTHKILKTLRGQYWSKSDAEFRLNYLDLIHYLDNKCKKIIIIPPLLFGEDLTNDFNLELSVYIEIIKDIIGSYPHIDYLDVHQAFVDFLSTVETSNYIPESIFDTGKDVALLKENSQVDNQSHSRGLHLTLDGVHLNSKGATIVSDMITKYINQ